MTGVSYTYQNKQTKWLELTLSRVRREGRRQSGYSLPCVLSQHTVKRPMYKVAILCRNLAHDKHVNFAMCLPLGTWQRGRRGLAVSGTLFFAVGHGRHTTKGLPCVPIKTHGKLLLPADLCRAGFCCVLHTANLLPCAILPLSFAPGTWQTSRIPQCMCAAITKTLLPNGHRQCLVALPNQFVGTMILSYLPNYLFAFLQCFQLFVPCNLPEFLLIFYNIYSCLLKFNMY